MIWAGLLLILCILFVAVLVWKPAKRPHASGVSSNGVRDMLSASMPQKASPLDDEIAIIAEALREQDAKRKRTQAMERLRSLLDGEDDS